MCRLRAKRSNAYCPYFTYFVIEIVSAVPVERFERAVKNRIKVHVPYGHPTHKRVEFAYEWLRKQYLHLDTVLCKVVLYIQHHYNLIHTFFLLLPLKFL